VRALTFNIHHGVGLDGVHDLERVAEVIEGAAADLAGLQEVDRHLSARSDYLDQAAWLAERLDMDMAYGPVVDLGPTESGPAGVPRQYGVALLSRAPLREPRNLLLTRPRGGEQRGLLGAVVDADGRAVRVLCTHLQHRSRIERRAQATQIAEALAAGTGPVVMMGDLNARPGDPEIAPLTAVLDDAWVVAGDGPGFTFDAATPHARIDYVLTSADLAARSAAVLPADASDHLAVVAELDLDDAGRAAEQRNRFALDHGPRHPREMHLTAPSLEDGLDHVRNSPTDIGRVELIVRRPAVDEREVLDEGILDLAEGLVGDSWKMRGSSRTADGSSHPDMQLNIINARLSSLVAVDLDRRALAGDQLHLDLDLSHANLPPGTRLALGSAVIEVTDIPHRGCAKFRARFGADALRFVNSPTGRELRLRGLNARVVVAGTVRRGDDVRKLVP
jgi:endonuclease/exonuclease/phosphatase family metal-dependent hydrolase